MNDKRIEESIKRVVDGAPIDLLDQIKAKTVPKMLHHDAITRQSKGSSLRKRIMPMATAAAVIFMAGFWQYQYRTPDSEIYMDINPSIELVTNRRNQVIDILPGNEDGAELVYGLDYKGEDYLEVTEEILDLMILKGYLDDNEQLMLLSVYNENLDKESVQLTELDAFIHGYLLERGIDPVILGQKIEMTNTIRDYAREYGISASKMTFIRNLMILHPDLVLDELVPLSLQELVELSRQLGIDLKGIIESQDWEKLPGETDHEGSVPHDDDDDDETDEIDDDNEDEDEEDDDDDHDTDDDDTDDESDDD